MFDNLCRCMIITEDDREEIVNLKKRLFQEFEMKDLGCNRLFFSKYRFNII